MEKCGRAADCDRGTSWGFAMALNFARRLKSGLKPSGQKLSRDQGGNVLIMTAAVLIPLIGIIGSGIDIGRSYMTQLRLQQACDAGTLAGRRAMAGGTYDQNAENAANAMFWFNFPQGMYGTNNVNFSADTDGTADVFGTATAVLPTSLMYIFGFDQFNLSVNCGAKMEIANTDVMLVLDITGSMNEALGTKKKIVALQDAARSFVTTLLGAEQGDGRLRVGVVPYSGTVNVGKILHDKNPNWISNTVTIPSVNATYSSNKWNYTLANRTFTLSGMKPGQPYTLATGTGTGTTSSTRRQSDVTATWEGCVMERGTTHIANGGAIPANAYDMSITEVPGAGDETKWKVFIPNHAFPRSSSGNGSASTTYPSNFHKYAEDELAKVSGKDPARTVNGNFGICPDAPAMNLTTIEQVDDAGHKAFKDVISRLLPRGLTYHDTGIAWGARLISPVGLFAYENSVDRTENQLPISRHIIFMTDGEMYTSNTNYSHQGHEVSMNRLAPNGTSASNVQIRQKYRFLQLCERAKQQGIEIWVVSFGTQSERTQYNPDIRPCSSRDYVYEAGSSDELDAAFVAIAGQISRLRVSQ